MTVPAVARPPAPAPDHHLTDDLLGLLDDIGADKAVFVGHDWGSMVVGQMALLHPERVHGVAVMSVPLLPRGPVAPMAMMRRLFATTFFSIVYFQEPGVADADLGQDPAETTTRMLAGPTMPAEGGPDLAGLASPDGGGFVDRLPKAEGLPGGRALGAAGGTRRGERRPARVPGQPRARERGMSEGRFTGQVALVTGAARPRGIGRATALILAADEAATGARAITGEAVNVSAGQTMV